ncbi:hypothetical protein MASR2M12_03110 [Bacteroidales bacterium]
MGIFFKRRLVPVPTFWGGLLILFTFFSVAYLLLRASYPFLSPTYKPVSKTLVIEGWIPESGLKEALTFYRTNHYEKMIITGVPITQWTYSSPFSNMADASAGSMRLLHFNDTIYRAIIPSTIQRDRTYSTAVSMKMQLSRWGIASDNFDLYSMGAHARRSYLMFKKAFPKSNIGLITSTDPSFDPIRWYASSRGFRTVFGEFVSYFYSLLLFHPNENQTVELIKLGEYYDTVTSHRYETDREFADSLTSPLGKSDLSKFEGLDYYPVDTAWKLKAVFVVDTTQPPFQMPTSTSRLPLYRKYGEIHFAKDGIDHKLFAYQNLDYLKKEPGHHKLFVPFSDHTNGVTTYGGGRYLDIDIPQNPVFTLDFNYAYNPYCAYHHRWSCPIPPSENSLETEVSAGVKSYNTPN